MPIGDPTSDTGLNVCVALEKHTSDIEFLEFEDRTLRRLTNSFAAIAVSSENGAPGGYSVVVSNAGDWTGQMISRAFEDSPKEIWIRGMPTCGVLHMANLFRRIVLVATGSVSVLVLRFFGRERWRRGFFVPSSNSRDRPDFFRMAYGLYIQAHAEAVIISNPAPTHRVVYGLESREVPAFGAIWDS
ncbi:hypothetical protein FPQ18DRAFT_394000 [Pyronema domesticum]|nr:hypothetical protein FPQ18DRAFT_394000 [Pyronema domesticum]